MRTCYFIAVGFGLIIGLVVSGRSGVQIAVSQETKSVATGELKTLEASAKEFESAFNKGDAAAIAAQFMEKAEVVDDDGNLIVGRDKIQDRFAEVFKTYPKAKISVELTSLRQITPDVAVEDGYNTTDLGSDEPASRSPYTVIHLRRNGKWQIASIRDFPEESDDTAHDQLQALTWLVGDWVDKSGDAKVETSCRWDKSGNFLIQDYVVKTREGSELRGTQRIGWDAERKTVRSWSFDDGGGFVESIWTAIDQGWLIRADGYSPDGRHVSATRIATLMGPDLYQFDSTNRIIGDQLLPDTSVRVARRPPSPVGEGKESE